MQRIDIVVIIILPSQLAICETMIMQSLERTLFMNLFSRKKKQTQKAKPAHRLILNVK